MDASMSLAPRLLALKCSGRMVASRAPDDAQEEAGGESHQHAGPKRRVQVAAVGAGLALAVSEENDEARRDLLMARVAATSVAA
jgi:hypothetical protein